MRISDWSSDVCSSDLQMLEVEAPARRLAAAMLAHDAVEPAFKTAGQVEISPVDRQHQRAIEHARIEPVGQEQLDPERPALRVAPFLPLGEPISEEHTSQIQSLIRISYAVCGLKKKQNVTLHIQ